MFYNLDSPSRASRRRGRPLFLYSIFIKKYFNDLFKVTTRVLTDRAREEHACPRYTGVWKGRRVTAALPPRKPELEHLSSLPGRPRVSTQYYTCNCFDMFIKFCSILIIARLAVRGGGERRRTRRESPPLEPRQ